MRRLLAQVAGIVVIGVVLPACSGAASFPRSVNITVVSLSGPWLVKSTSPRLLAATNLQDLARQVDSSGAEPTSRQCANVDPMPADLQGACWQLRSTPQHALLFALALDFKGHCCYTSIQAAELSSDNVLTVSEKLIGLSPNCCSSHWSLAAVSLTQIPKGMLTVKIKYVDSQARQYEGETVTVNLT